MTPEQLSMIEARLNVTLPPAYKTIMVAFPWQKFAGSTELSLFDDAVLNVERTLEYREGYGGAARWPSNYLHIGDDDDACPYAMNCSDGKIVKTDHGSLQKPPLATFASVDLLVRRIQHSINDDA